MVPRSRSDQGHMQKFVTARTPLLLHRGVARSENVGWTHGERGARAFNGDLGAEPPAGSRDRAPGQTGLKLKTF